MTLEATLTTEDILAAFADAGTTLPREAMRQAIDSWPETGRSLLDLLRQVEAGAEITEAVGGTLFFGIHLMAQQREHGAYRPLCAIGMQGAHLFDVLGDSVTETLSHILARVFDGDPEPLHRLMACPEADEFNRYAAFVAYAWLAATGRTDRDVAAGFLQDFAGSLDTSMDGMTAAGWLHAVALLNVQSLVPAAEALLGSDDFDDIVTDRSAFHEDLENAQDPGTLAVALNAFEAKVDALEDVVAYLSAWASFSEDVLRPPPETPHYNYGAPVRNPLRHVGRNDPCPCGSGKKYKKCCLP